MNVDLDKKDLIALIKGCGKSSYTLATFLEERKLGRLDGFPNERWTWNDAELKKLTEHGLWAVYRGIMNWQEPEKEPLPELSPERLAELHKLYFEKYGVWLTA